MVDLIRGLEPDHVRRNLARIQEQITLAAPDRRVQLLAAVKYLAAEELDVLAQAGVTLLGENRAQDLIAKAEEHPSKFTWDFIGQLQSRKVKLLVPRVRYIHSVASDSALEQLRRHGTGQTRVLVEVNVGGEPGKSGVTPDELPAFLERAPVTVAGLMTMPPLAADPEQSRPYFARLRALADRHGLQELSMGTSQDYLVAVQEGATIVRLGTVLYEAPHAPDPARKAS